MDIQFQEKEHQWWWAIHKHMQDIVPLVKRWPDGRSAAGKVLAGDRVCTSGSRHLTVICLPARHLFTLLARSCFWPGGVHAASIHCAHPIYFSCYKPCTECQLDLPNMPTSTGLFIFREIVPNQNYSLHKRWAETTMAATTTIIHWIHRGDYLDV